MTTPNTSNAIDLVTLAERMGIPADEALRQVALLTADVDHTPVPTEPADVPSVAVA